MINKKTKKRYNRTYYLKHKEKIKKKVKEYCKKVEYKHQKKWYKKNRKEFNNYQKEYNKEKRDAWNKLSTKQKLNIMNQFSTALLKD